MASDQSELVSELFTAHNPEIAAGIVEIKRIARRAGTRTKVALHSNDPTVDAVGICVGNRGERIQPIIDRLNGERIDLLRWDQSPVKMITYALQPAAIKSVSLNEADNRATVVVKQDQLQLALGSRDENRELAGRLCGLELDIVAE